MGFLNIFKKREEPLPELPPADIRLSGLYEWLGQELSEKIQSARRKAGEIQEGIARDFGQLGDSAKRLGKAEFEARDKAYAAVNSVKNTFANRAQSLAGKCPAPVQDSYSGVAEFRERAGDLLRGLMEINPRQGMILSSYFKRESAPLMAGIKKISGSLEGLQRLLDYEGRPLFVLEEAGRVSREIGRRLENLRNLDKREREIEGEIRALKEALSRREKELGGVLKDPGWRELEKAKREGVDLEARASDLRFRLGEELSSAKRPLKKYLHLKSGELSREDRNFLERFVKSPLKAVMSGRTGQLNSHLLTLKGMVGREINLKDKEVQKLEELIRRMESGETGKSLDGYEGILEGINKRAEAMERDFSGLNERKGKAESGVNETKEAIERLRMELEETKERAKSLRGEAEKSREGLEALIYENINRRVNILLDNGAIG